MNPESIILVLNNDLAQDPRIAHVNPVSVEHTLIQCPRCHEDCWIGPQQKCLALASALNGGPQVRCYKCVLKDPETRGLLTEMISLNPAIEDAPRRFPQNG